MHHRRALFLIAALLLAPHGASAEALHPERRGIGLLPLPAVRALSEAPTDAAVPTILPRMSLFVTDESILARFTLAEVMEKLASASTVPGAVTKESLFRQWWDTAAKAPGVGPGPHCDDIMGADGKPALNGFPYTCPRKESEEAVASPFLPDTQATNGYSAIALANRFDLTSREDQGGADCGEYRIVFARNSGKTTPTNRNLIIFEAVLPNPGKPKPAGCRPVAEFLAGLSTIQDPAKRAEKLHDFYFKGLPGFGPVVTAKNYGSATEGAKGQIRTNQFMQSNWLLREFLVDLSEGRPVIRPTTVKANPAGLLFEETIAHPLSAAFRTAFLEEVDTLQTADIHRFDMDGLAPGFNSGQSDSQDDLDNAYVKRFAKSPTFREAVKSKITTPALTPEHIVRRAEVLSCAGCHRLSSGADLGGGLTWPKHDGFTHVSEATMEPCPHGGNCFAISATLKDLFLGHRRDLLEAFLKDEH